MIQISKILTQAIGLVGVRQSTKTGATTIEDELKASRSGLYIQDGSALAEVENIVSSMNDDGASAANINDYLEQLLGSSFVELTNRIFSENDFIENMVLFPFENKWTDLETLGSTDFVGYEINIPKNQNISILLNKIMLEFDGIETVKILLFNSQKNALIDSQEITTVANSRETNSVQWNLTDVEVQGGMWYVGYLTSGLTASPVQRNYQIANVQNFYNGMTIKAIKVEGWNAETLFDINEIEYVSNTWGMNFDFSTFLDYTSLIVNNEKLFAKAQQLQVCVNILQMLAGSTRSNRVERLTRNMALNELNGNKYNLEVPESIGLLSKLNAEIRRLEKTFTNKGMNIKMTLV